MLRVLQRERGLGAMQRLRALARCALRPAALTAGMFLMMRAELLMRASPLAAALMAAGLAAGESAAALAAGCLLGALRLPLTEAALLPAICCATVLTEELVCSLAPALKRGAEETRVSLVAGLGVLLPSLVWAGGDALNSLRALACAAGLALIVGVAGLTLGREKDMTDRVAAPSASLRTLREDEIVSSAAADACFHLRKDCSRAEADQVALQLVTALEFEKELCPACGGNVLLP